MRVLKQHCQGLGVQQYPASRQVIVELEGGEGSATDMAGDAGVVGRWLVQPGAGGAQPQLQLDLKGVLYNASLVGPPACRACCRPRRPTSTASRMSDSYGRPCHLRHSVGLAHVASRVSI